MSFLTVSCFLDSRYSTFSRIAALSFEWYYGISKRASIGSTMLVSEVFAFSDLLGDWTRFHVNDIVSIITIKKNRVAISYSSD